MIREIVATTGAKVDINDEGIVKVSASDGAKIKARDRLDQVVITMEPEPAYLRTVRRQGG